MSSEASGTGNGGTAAPQGGTQTSTQTTTPPASGSAGNGGISGGQGGSVQGGTQQGSQQQQPGGQTQDQWSPPELSADLVNKASLLFSGPSAYGGGFGQSPIAGGQAGGFQPAPQQQQQQQGGQQPQPASGGFKIAPEAVKAFAESIDADPKAIEPFVSSLQQGVDQYVQQAVAQVVNQLAPIQQHIQAQLHNQAVSLVSKVAGRELDPLFAGAVVRNAIEVRAHAAHRGLPLTDEEAIQLALHNVNPPQQPRIMTVLAKAASQRTLQPSGGPGAGSQPSTDSTSDLDAIAAWKKRHSGG